MDKVHLEKVNDATRLAFINLYNLYRHDLAKYIPDTYFSVDQEGYYDKDSTTSLLETSDQEVMTYIIRYMNEIAGFMVFTLSPYVKPGCDYCIQEIFVLNNYRNKAIAREACKIIFNEFPGKYCIQILENNIVALKYWDSVIEREGHLIELEKNDNSLITYEFEVKNIVKGEG